MYKFTNDIIQYPIIFKDEPHFQYEVLHRRIPLLYNNLEYFPLVAEFPSSPGIDLIYFNSKGEIILAEFKHNSTRFELAQKETIHHYEKYKRLSIQDIIKYAESNEMETNQLSFEQFKKVFSNKINSRLIDLFEKNELESIALFNGVESAKVSSICSDVIFLSFDKNSVRVKNIEYNGKPISTEAIYKAYNQENLNSKIIRKLRSKSEFDKEIESRNIGFMKKIYVQAKEKGFYIKPGTGQKLSYSIQIRDLYKKYRTVLKVFETQIGIPGNLYNQHRYLNVSLDELDFYFDGMKNLFTEFNIKETNAGTVNIEIQNLSDKMIEDLFVVMSLFNSKVQNYI